MSDWTDPLWVDEADGWIRDQLARLGTRSVGAIDQFHVRPWATVMRVPTETGDVYFKANEPASRHEAALVRLLAARRPDCVPPLLAADFERGWMLMADAGTRLREIVERERDMNCWFEIMPLYAGLQIDLAGDADDMVALGVPDLRLASLSARYEQLLDSLAQLPPSERVRLLENVTRVREMCDELSGYGLPETIQHDDFHDGQVFVRDGHYLLLDWGDACVSHPFFTLSVTLEGVLAGASTTSRARLMSGRSARRTLSASLGRQRCGPRCRRRDRDAARVGLPRRQRHLAGSEEARIHVLLRMFLDGRP